MDNGGGRTLLGDVVSTTGISGKSASEGPSSTMFSLTKEAMSENNSRCTSSMSFRILCDRVKHVTNFDPSLGLQLTGILDDGSVSFTLQSRVEPLDSHGTPPSVEVRASASSSSGVKARNINETWAVFAFTSGSDSARLLSISVVLAWLTETLSRIISKLMQWPARRVK